MSTNLAELTFRVWFIEILVSGINYFVLMRLVYEPRVGALRAHQIGMSTRIAYIFVSRSFSCTSPTATRRWNRSTLAAFGWR